MGAWSAAPRAKARRALRQRHPKGIPPIQHAVLGRTRCERMRGPGSGENSLVLPRLPAPCRWACQAFPLLQPRTADAGLCAENHVQRRAIERVAGSRTPAALACRRRRCGRALGAERPRRALPRRGGLAIREPKCPRCSVQPQDQPRAGRPARSRGHGALSFPLRKSDPDLREPGGRRCDHRDRADEWAGSDDPQRYRRGAVRIERRRFPGGVRRAPPASHDHRLQASRPCAGSVRSAG